MDTLTLGYGHRPGEQAKTERNYVDFIVSGQSLGQLVRSIAFRQRSVDFDQIGIFGWIPDKWYENNQIDEFLGIIPPELVTGRTSFYVCPECGDIGCGAITAKIDVTDRYVIWKDFGYETTYSEPDLAGYEEIGPFTFEKTVYFNTFDKLRRLILKW